MLLEQSRCVRNNVGLVEKYARGLRRAFKIAANKRPRPPATSTIVP